MFMSFPPSHTPLIPLLQPYFAKVVTAPRSSFSNASVRAVLMDGETGKAVEAVRPGHSLKFWELDDFLAGDTIEELVGGVAVFLEEHVLLR